MLSDKQVRMLQLLDTKVDKCNKCSLKQNGTAFPFWTRKSKYVIIGEAPGANEVRQQTPFIGAAGRILTDELSKAGFKAEDFLIINTCQCRPVDGNRNAKPNDAQIIACQDILRKYIKVLNPEKILCLGNYAKYIFTGNIQGILRERGTFKECFIMNQEVEGVDKKFNVLFTIHPAYCIYNQDEGRQYLKDDIELFKETEFIKEEEWFLSEDDFRF